jgi:DNA polymerase III delta prime subunit
MYACSAILRKAPGIRILGLHIDCLCFRDTLPKLEGWDKEREEAARAIQRVLDLKRPSGQPVFKRDEKPFFPPWFRPPWDCSVWGNTPNLRRTWTRRPHPESVDDVAKEFLEAGGALFHGPPGTGKTTFLKKLVAKLEADHNCKVFRGAFTHAAAKNSDGVTFHHLLHRHMRTLLDRKSQGKVPVLWLEEVSLCPQRILGNLMRWQMLGCKFLVSGDFWQLGPPVDVFGDATQRFEDSSALHAMCCGLRYDFTICRRQKGPLALAHFNWVCNLNNHPEGRLLPQLLQETRQRFAARDLNDVHIYLCLSHRVREFVSYWWLRTHFRAAYEAGLPHIFADPGELLGAPQETHMAMIFYEGIELVGCRRTSGPGVVNGILYVVREVHSDPVGITIETLKGDAKLRLPIREATEQLRHASARVVAGCQGLTFEGKRVLLLQADHRFFTRRHLYVAASRVDLPDNFLVPSVRDEALLLKKAKKLWEENLRDRCQGGPRPARGEATYFPGSKLHPDEQSAEERAQEVRVSWD